MTYNVKINGKNYELPRRTLEIDDRIEEIEGLSRRYTTGDLTRREMIQAQYDFVQHCTGGALDELESLDVNDLLQHTINIINTYTAPAIEAQRQAAMSNVAKLVNSPEIGKMLALKQHIR